MDPATDIVLEVTGVDNVTARRVLAHEVEAHVVPAVPRRAADSVCALPDELGEVAGLGLPAGGVEVVVLALVAKGADGVPGGLVAVGDVLAVGAARVREVAVAAVEVALGEVGERRVPVDVVGAVLPPVFVGGVEDVLLEVGLVGPAAVVGVLRGREAGEESNGEESGQLHDGDGM